MNKPLPPELMKDPVYAAALQDNDCRVYSRFKLESSRSVFSRRLSLRSAYEIVSASIDTLEAITGVGVFAVSGGIIENGFVNDAVRHSGSSFGDLERRVYSGGGDLKQFERVSLNMVSAEDDSLMVSVSPDYFRVEISPADSKDGGRPFFAVHPLAKMKRGLPESVASVWAQGVGGLASRLNRYFGSVNVDAAPSHVRIDPDGNRALMPVYGMPYFRFDGRGGFSLIPAGEPGPFPYQSLIPLPTGHVVSRSLELRRFPVDAVKYAVGLGLPPQNIRLAVIVCDELDKMHSANGPGGLGLDYSNERQAVCDYAVYGATKAGRPFIAFSDLQSLCGSDLGKMLVIAKRIGDSGISVSADDALAVDMLADARKSERVCDHPEFRPEVGYVRLPLSLCGKSQLARAVYGAELGRQIEYAGRKNRSELSFFLREIQRLDQTVRCGANYLIEPMGLGNYVDFNPVFAGIGDFLNGWARAGSIIAQDISSVGGGSSP